MVSNGDIIRQPAPDARSTSRLGQYLTWLENERGLHFDDYESLWQWSVDDLDGFWDSLWDHFDVDAEGKRGPVLGRREMPGAEWFPESTINFGGEIIRKLEARPDALAFISVSQTRETTQMTNAELLDLIARVRRGLIELGVGRGDRVVAIMPNIPETAAAWFACASLGAIWASCAPEFGPQAVIDRFGQLDPTVLLTVDGYHFGDRDIDIRDRVAAVREAIPTIEHTVALDYNGRAVANSTPWATFTAELGDLAAVPLPFAHPLCVLFSSGTTGLPKAIVHGHGGLTLEISKNCALSWDIGPGDRLMFFSTTAWMMWNGTVAALLVGATVITIDGNPMYPDLEAQWRIAAETGTTVLGLGPAYIMGCAKAGLEPTEAFDLSSVRLLVSGGAPMPAEGHVWLDDRFGADAPMILGSGGTDVCTGIVQGNLLVPVYAGEMSARMLGVAVAAYDDDGNEVVGELGEMVITQPMPSMPVAFWGDDDMRRLRSTYFEHYPGVMRFGDWIRFTEHGSSLITGRSDATLNRGGVRIGTAEIYRVVEQRPDVESALIVHLEDDSGGMGELVMFVVPIGRPVDDAFRADLVSQIRTELSPRHGPNTIVEVSDIPLNMTRKKLELPVKKIMRGADPGSVVSRQAMVNPDALDEYIEIARSRTAGSLR